MKRQLTRADLEAALEFVGTVQGAEDLDSYRHAVLGIDALVPGNIVSYNEIEAGGKRLFSVTRPPVLNEENMAVFGRYLDQNPLYTYHAATEDPAPKALSDLISAERFHATDIYRQFYAQWGIEDQIAMRLPAPPDTVIAVVINRTSRGFEPRERDLLELVRPHALQSFRMAAAAEHSRREIAELRARVGHRPPAVEAALTPREREVLERLVAGASTAEIAGQLSISAATVRKHIEHVREKLGVHSRVELVARLLSGEISI